MPRRVPGAARRRAVRQKGDARRNELRAVFALFDVESRGAISLMDVRNAVKAAAAPGCPRRTRATGRSSPRRSRRRSVQLLTARSASGRLRGSWKGALRRDDEDDV